MNSHSKLDSQSNCPDSQAPIPPSVPALNLSGVRLNLGRAGSDRVVFELDSLEAPMGMKMALTGPSGCGKSTLLNLVSGLKRPDSGEVFVVGEPVHRLSGSKADAFRGQRLGFIHQNFHLLSPFTALENVLIGMQFGRKISRSERTDRAEALLKRVGLSQKAQVRVSNLSVGERQRVAVARAVANRPSLLLADEPTGSLDPETSEEVFQLILEICEDEGCALLFVTHDHQLADRLPDRFDCQGLVRHIRLKEAQAQTASR